MAWQEPKTDWEAADVVTASDFNRIEGNIKELNETLMPIGAIIMWSGKVADIPTGWRLCDGNNGTPNLKDRFIMGAVTDATINKTGGQNEVTLTVNQIPAHQHTGGTNSAGEHSHYYYEEDSPSYGRKEILRYSQGWEKRITSYGLILPSGSHSHTVTINNTGGGQSHENRPAYYKLAFIMKV